MRYPVPPSPPPARGMRFRPIAGTSYEVLAPSPPPANERGNYGRRAQLIAPQASAPVSAPVPPPGNSFLAKLGTFLVVAAPIAVGAYLVYEATLTKRERHDRKTRR